MTTPRPKRPRLRRVLKWTGLITCLLIVVAWGFSLRWHVMRRETTVVVGLFGGLVVAETTDRRKWPPYTPPKRWEVTTVTPGGGRYGFVWDWPLVVRRPSSQIVVWFPLWLLLLAVAIPTGFLFYRDRRRIPPGHCQQCGYDLTGNESGVCPECGTTTVNRDGSRRVVLNAVDARTGESFTVSAGTLYEAAIELAGQVGVDLEDG